MNFQDKVITCKDCLKDFNWTAGEQKFFADKGLQNPPSRCPECRKQVKDRKASQPKYTITCKDCGKTDEVPFQPFNQDDVFCAECFAKKRANEASQ